MPFALDLGVIAAICDPMERRIGIVSSRYFLAREVVASLAAQLGDGIEPALRIGQASAGLQNDSDLLQDLVFGF